MNFKCGNLGRTISWGSRSGFTLIELLVYMAILGIVVLVAGQVFKDSTMMRVRTQNMLRANQLAEEAAGYIFDDVAQMGAKMAENTKMSGEYTKSDKVFIDPDNVNDSLKDFSSFVLKKEGDFDSLAFRAMRYDDEGLYVGVDEVSWYVTDIMDGDIGKLVRKCRRIDKPATVADDPLCPEKEDASVVIADSVSRFVIIPARPAQLTASEDKLIFPKDDSTQFRLVPRIDGKEFFRINVDPYNGGSSVEISNFANNYKEGDAYVDTSLKKANQLFVAEASPHTGTPGAGADSNKWEQLCARLELDSLQEYEISFSMPLMVLTDVSQTFVPGMDHMAVGIRKANGTAIPRWRDFLFYPPEGEMAGEVRREFRFSVEHSIDDACIAFTFAFYSPLVSSGKMTISSLKVRKVMDANYTFDPNFKLDSPKDIPDKKLVHAFQIHLEVSKHGEKGSVRQVVQTPNNGAATD